MRIPKPSKIAPPPATRMMPGIDVMNGGGGGGWGLGCGNDVGLMGRCGTLVPVLHHHDRMQVATHAHIRIGRHQPQQRTRTPRSRACDP